MRNEKWEMRNVDYLTIKWLNIVNYAFDMVSPKCITWIVTEFGIIRPENLMRAVEKYYPRMLE
jgi:translation initiation factor 2B subunit (eIF-2B alpha/beta/delta family)